jgi:hypothetical protein
MGAGASWGGVSVGAPCDDVHVFAGTVWATISVASGGNFEALAIDTTPATTAITDTIDVTTVSLTASPAVAEGGAIVYTATLDTPALSPVTVTLTGGTTITIAAGATSGTVAIAAPADDVYVDAGSVARAITGAVGGGFDVLNVDTTPATTTITDTIDNTTLALTASPSVAEGGLITYTASLSAPAQSAVTVNLSNGAVITIATGASTGSVNVSAPSDDVYLDAGSVSATIGSASGGNFENLVVNTAAAPRRSTPPSPARASRPTPTTTAARR